MKLNEKARRLVDQFVRCAEEHRITFHDDGINVPVADCGVEVAGSLGAGLAMARISAGGLADVQIVPDDREFFQGPAVSFRTDQPVASCLAAQYAGWKIDDDGYFAMGSGPMRAAAAKEDLFSEIGYREASSVAVGVLESSQLPPAAVCERLAAQCEVEPRKLTLLVAKTASLAGTLQVVARSVETALHKLHAVGFDMSTVRSGWGVAPLPPIARDDLNAIGRTNDAIIYGGRVQLWVDADDDAIAEIINKVPSNASTAHGECFMDIFKANDCDFYKIDPMLFSPAWIRINNLSSGRSFESGQVTNALIKRSFLS